jgi:ABC-type multidrug transport system ATPase subunit
MIELLTVSAGRKPVVLTDVTFRCPSGVHAIVGTRRDGTDLMFSLVTGKARARTGTARVLGSAPNDREIRAQTAHVSLEPISADGLRVHELLATASTLRGEPARDSAERLHPLGVEHLAHRAIASLSQSEARAVALAEGLSSARVRVLLVEEPFVAMAPQAAGHVRKALRDKAATGCVVIVATASSHDACQLADRYALLRKGLLVRTCSSLEELTASTRVGGRMIAVAQDSQSARSLVQALAGEEAIDGLECDGPAVEVRGNRLLDVARATARAALQARLELVELNVEQPFPERDGAAEPQRVR